MTPQYSKNSKIRTPNFRNSRLFEINFGHVGLGEYGILLTILMTVNKNTCYWCVKETSSRDVPFKHQKHMFDKKTLIIITFE